MKLLNLHPKLRCIFIVPFLLIAIEIALEELCFLNMLVALIPLWFAFVTLEKATIIKTGAANFMNNMVFDWFCIYTSLFVISRFFKT